jgi:hypothetical protein
MEIRHGFIPNLVPISLLMEITFLSGAFKKQIAEAQNKKWQCNDMIPVAVFQTSIFNLPHH